MNSVETGKLIAKLRKEAGYTQASLAAALFVTDKAVSKWERGLCAPDSSLLPKLSMLLDADIEYLIAGNRPYGEHRWVGEILVDDVEGELAGRPLLHYLLSYFMLVNVTDIYIKTKKQEYVKNLQLERYGLTIRFSSVADQKSIVVYDKFLLFGANLTRYLQSFLYGNENVIPVLDGRELPLLVTHHPSFSLDWHKKNCKRKTLGRGMIFLPLNDDAEQFVQIYERNGNRKIADLSEIAKNRKLV